MQYSKILKKNWEIIALIIGVSVVFSLIISLFSPFQYSATTKILIIQKQTGNLDAYTAVKSAGMIGQNFASVINTSSFYNETLAANSSLQDKFPQDSIERMKMWDKNVKVSVVPDTGMLEITAYDTDRDFASQLVKAISYVLVNKGSEYHGGGNDVEIKIVDDAFVSKYPVRPNIFLNMGLAAVLGIALGCAFVILTESRRVKKQLENDSNIKAELADDEFNPSSAEIIAEPIAAREVEVKTMYDSLQS